jgi:tRNA(Ile2) C34 agmatinyltransferase TiaS
MSAMASNPSCKLCGRPLRQQGRYADWRCECCDDSVNCPHISKLARLKRKMSGRRV